MTNRGRENTAEKKRWDRARTIDALRVVVLETLYSKSVERLQDLTDAFKIRLPVSHARALKAHLQQEVRREKIITLTELLFVYFGVAVERMPTEVLKDIVAEFGAPPLSATEAFTSAIEGEVLRREEGAV